jgi:hypothetical protein
MRKQQMRVYENPPPRGRRREPTSVGQYSEKDENVKMPAMIPRAFENPPSRGRRRELMTEGHYDVEDSAFAKMIIEKWRGEKVPPLRGRKRGRIKQVENAQYLAKETQWTCELVTQRQEEVAKMTEARRRVEEVPQPKGRKWGRLKREMTPISRIDIRLDMSSQSPTGNQRMCGRLTVAGICKNALRRTDRMDWTDVRSCIQFITRATPEALVQNGRMDETQPIWRREWSRIKRQETPTPRINARLEESS